VLVRHWRTVPADAHCGSHTCHQALVLMQLGRVQVTYKRTELLHDQVLLSGFAAGGLTEVPQGDYRSAGFATVIAGELGMFGLRPEVHLPPALAS